MIFDVIKEVILILDSSLSIVDIFACTGLTERELPENSRFFTYKKLLIREGTCALCGKPSDRLDAPCVSNSGKHAITGRNLDHIPLLHRASSYNIPLYPVPFEEFVFYLEKDNIFPLDPETGIPDPPPTNTGDSETPSDLPDRNSFDV